ncbi:sodium-dependent bicarbonate transport family permease [Schlesneria paludicola]|uniref:sodium-dependent bicarbonate transport family permease n=1 Tax=Schlesneria paludicola TaxID=360056 RepID=UPI00029A1A50|nr:sodium-dependent bicarbonate transport family permease [Schlesneria paludicola]
MLNEFIQNFTHNLFKPLLLFFYAGFLIPIFKVKLEFPKAVYQGLTIYLLLSIGWHGGEELAGLEPAMYRQAAGFMLIGFCTNTLIGIVAYKVLRWTTRLRQVDAATVAGFYGSDSAGTFVTAMGVLTAGHIAFAPYMPVMLAVMEIPGCLVALYIVSKMRQAGMDAAGNMPGEQGYDRFRKAMISAPRHLSEEETDSTHGDESEAIETEGELAEVGAAVRHRQSANHHPTSRTNGGSSYTVGGGRTTRPSSISQTRDQFEHGAPTGNTPSDPDREAAEREEAHLALQNVNLSNDEYPSRTKSKGGWLSKELLHEVFLNPGIFLLFAGITIGFIGRLQGERVTSVDDALFVNLFHGMLCVFLLEMGMTASSKLKDLRTAGWQFVAFALIAPNIFATVGMLIAHGYSVVLGEPFEIGTYVLFAVLCGAASYIAVPAVQRLAIPEASPTLPLAASLGVTFSYNVTVGIPVYIMIATILTRFAPVV